jgi:hypothetical protein
LRLTKGFFEFKQEKKIRRVLIKSFDLRADHLSPYEHLKMEKKREREKKKLKTKSLLVDVTSFI